MQRISQFLIFCLTVSLLSSCTDIPDKDWYALIPENTSFVIVPDQGVNVQDIVTKRYASFLDDLTPSAIQQIAEIDVEDSNLMEVKALALHPSSSTQSEFLWITQSLNSDIKEWAPRFYRPFTQNNYNFRGLTIHKLFFNKNEIFTAQVNNWLILSESSLVVEYALRTYLGEDRAMQIEEAPIHGTLVVNTPRLDKWLEQFSSVMNRPSLLNKFSGTKPVTLQISNPADSTNNVRLTGKIELQNTKSSALVDAFSYRNRPITLDRHIASNATAFALLRLPPVSVPVMPEGGVLTPLDSLLTDNIDLYQDFANILDSEFGFEAFAQSGLMTSGEFLFMRKLRNRNAFQQLLNNLVRDGLITHDGNSYQISSSIMGTLIGSELSSLRDFWLSFSNDVVVIAKRKGLSESVNADRIRRRVIYYDETYSAIRDDLPEEVSGFVWSDSDELMTFIAPYLKPENQIGGLLSRFDITSITMTTERDAVNLTLNTFTREGSSLPYEEMWIMPIANFELSGTPVLGDVVGSSANEIIISMQNGRVLALAIDGTIAMEASTNGIAPVGSPQLYDWYGNGEQIVFLAAGSKIFAWNESGNLLPRFPIEMSEQITAPVLVQDILRNGVPEIVVATEDRKVHVLDGRGENVRGWPQNTNATVRSQPVFELADNVWSIWVFSENTLHSWLRNGNARPGYPQFVNARLTASPVLFDGQVLATGGDGYLYSIGITPIFDDSIATVISEDSVSIHSLYVANSELTSVVLHENVLLKDSTRFYREDLLITQSANGSMFLYNKQGKLRFTQSLGQPSSSSMVPIIADLNSDQNQELIALAEFGRLYAWEILTEQRLFNIPTSGMKYPVITDLNGDGRKELIAQTREGLRCWTINREN